MRVAFADVVFDSEERTVTREGRPLHLSPKAFNLLALILEARPRVVGKQAIVDALWPDVVVEEANVRNLVAEVRTALGERAASAIVTLPRVGYAFRGSSVPATAGSRFALAIQGREYPLAEGISVVGRAPDCTLVVRGSGVSHHHLRISVDVRGAVLEDLGSKNGTWLNGTKVSGAVPLRNGDEILFGFVVARFADADEAHATTTVHYR